MASIKLAAKDILDEARDGIGWIALWKDGKGWMSMAFWPDYDDRTDVFTFEPFQLEGLRNIIAIDPNACFVNGWYSNLGDTDCMTRDSLAAMLRWQYELGHNRLADALLDCIEVEEL